MIKHFQLNKQNDYLELLASDTIRTNLVADGTTIAANSCAFNTSYNAFRVNDASTGEKGALSIPVGFVVIGDIIEIEAEVYNVSGVGCKFGGDIFSKNTYQPADYKASLQVLTTNANSTFEKVKVTYTVETEGYLMLAIGSYTGDTGDYYIRNVKIKLNSGGSSYGVTTSKQTIKAYRISGTASGLIVDNNFGTDKATLTINSSLKFIQVSHDIPFQNTKKKTIGIACSNSYELPKYTFLVHGGTNAMILVSVFDTSTQTLVDPTLLANDSKFSFALEVIGYDY